MDYFKHYSNASSGNTLNHLMDEFGLKGYAWWFLLLELCSEHWDGISEPKFNFHARVVKSRLRATDAKVKSFLRQCELLSECSFTFENNSVQIHIPKLLEIKTSRKAIKINKNQTPIYIDKEKEEDIDIEQKNRNCDNEKVFSDPLELIECYNITLGHLKGSFSGFGLPPNALKDFLASSGFMPNLSDWENLFSIVASTEFLVQSNWCNLLWLVKYDNASKVLNGTYGEQIEEIASYPFTDEMTDSFREDLKNRLLEGFND